MTHRTCGRGSLVWLVALIGLSATALPGSARALEPDYQQWLQLQTDLKSGASKLLFNLDLQARRMNAPLAAIKDASGQVVGYAQNPNTMLLLRPALGYQVAPFLSVWGGYAFTPVFFDDPAARGAKNIGEHRVFEQVSTTFSLPRLALSTRTRLEQRLRSNGPGSSENDANLPHWGHRVRQLVRAQLSLIEDKPWLLVAWDELFIHLNDTNFPSERGLDQNRAFLGVGYQVSPALRGELGYLNQYVRRFSDPGQLNHVLSVSLAFKFDLATTPANGG